jgi:hypothetical protein
MLRPSPIAPSPVSSSCALFKPGALRDKQLSGDPEGSLQKVVDPSLISPGFPLRHEETTAKEKKMGDRALIIFTDGKEVSPVIYLHWSGSKVPDLLEHHKALMASRGADVSYAAARFVGIVHATMPEQNLSLGMWNTEPNTLNAVLSTDADKLTELSHGDAGFVVVDVQKYSWKAYGGYLSSRARGQQ